MRGSGDCDAEEAGKGHVGCNVLQAPCSAGRTCTASARVLWGVKKLTGKRSPCTLLSPVFLSSRKLEGNRGTSIVLGAFLFHKSVNSLGPAA